MAGSEHGSARTIEQLHTLASRVERTARQRGTTYGPVGRQQLGVAEVSG